MTIHVEEVNAEITALGANLPLTDAQIAALVQNILRKLEAAARETRDQRQDTRLNGSVRSVRSAAEGGDPWS